jgi:hypothetical protein
MARPKAVKAVNKELNLAIKTFKASPEVEALYQYIAENKLRAEALQLMEVVVKSITPAKKRAKRKLH